MYEVVAEPQKPQGQAPQQEDRGESAQGWTAVKGSRDQSSGRAAAVASTTGSRAQAPVEGGFLGLRHKTKETNGG